MPWFQNGTCDPFHPESKLCTLGNLVEYTINASSAADVAAGLVFAQAHNIRLAIKNTGHEYVPFLIQLVQLSNLPMRRLILSLVISGFGTLTREY